jgi:hypothetical protein
MVRWFLAGHCLAQAGAKANKAILAGLIFRGFSA